MVILTIQPTNATERWFFIAYKLENIMFGMLESLTKAAVSVAVTPVTAVIDAVMIPVDATEDGEVFQRTKNTLNNASKNFNEAVKPNSEN